MYIFVDVDTIPVDSIDLHRIMMRGGGGDPIGLTMGLASIGPVYLCMQNKKILNKNKNIRIWQGYTPFS